MMDLSLDQPGNGYRIEPAPFYAVHRSDGLGLRICDFKQCEFSIGIRPTRVNETSAYFRGPWIASLRSQ
jgi:hypothetical protein